MHKNMLCNENWLLRCSSYDSALGLYPRSYAVSVPSVWEEPLPYVIKETVAMGTVPIASRIGGIPEIVEGTYAGKMMFAPGNADELVRKLEEVLSLSKERLIDTGITLREAVLRRFNDEAIRSELLSVFV